MDAGAGRGFAKSDGGAVGARGIALAFRAEKAAVLRDCVKAALG